jgi:threonine/homoserine/homoserine lactone efflux protein
LGPADSMALQFFLKGTIIGFSIAAPVGPIGVLCIRRSLSDGRTVGLVTGLGAATADTAYGCIAAFGLTAVSSVLVAQKFWLGIIGGIFLCYLGAKTFFSKPASQEANVRGGGLLPAYLSTFLLTLTNPATILSFIAVFAGLGLGKNSDYLTATAMTTGVFVGSALWWLILSNGVGLLQSRANDKLMRMVNRVSGVIIFGFGIFALATARR